MTSDLPSAAGVRATPITHAAPRPGATALDSGTSLDSRSLAMQWTRRSRRAQWVGERPAPSAPLTLIRQRAEGPRRIRPPGTAPRNPALPMRILTTMHRRVTHDKGRQNSGPSPTVSPSCGQNPYHRSGAHQPSRDRPSHPHASLHTGNQPSAERHRSQRCRLHRCATERCAAPA